MKKEIKITFDEDKKEYQFEAQGFPHIEIIGIMEFYKQLYLSKNLKGARQNKTK